MKQLINQGIIKYILISVLVLNLCGCATSSRSESQMEQVSMDLIQENESNEVEIVEINGWLYIKYFLEGIVINFKNFIGI